MLNKYINVCVCVCLVRVTLALPFLSSGRAEVTHDELRS